MSIEQSGGCSSRFPFLRCSSRLSQVGIDEYGLPPRVIISQSSTPNDQLKKENFELFTQSRDHLESIYSHIALRVVELFLQRLGRHPADRQLARGRFPVVLLAVNVARQPEIGDLHHIPVTNQHVPRCQIAMNALQRSWFKILSNCKRDHDLPFATPDVPCRARSDTRTRSAPSG